MLESLPGEDCDRFCWHEAVRWARLLGTFMTNGLRKAAAHVSFEIEMLIFAGSQLGGWHSSPMAKPTGNPTDYGVNAFCSTSVIVQHQKYCFVSHLRCICSTSRYSSLRALSLGTLQERLR